MNTRIALHGGASQTKENSDELKGYVNDLAKKAKRRLDDGIKSVDIVEDTVRKLEEHGELNSGYGSKLQLDGVPRPEAGIMKSDLSMGVAIGLENVKYPVSVARTIMDNFRNNIIGSKYSTKIAQNERIERGHLVTHKRARNWWKLKKNMNQKDIYDQVKSLSEYDPSGGTVGCVALDQYGDLCAATSTGGRLYQSPGRIGDSPLVGCGFYCNEDIAVSTTGVGESIMKSQLAKRVHEEQLNNNKLSKSVKNALNYLSNNTDGSAGLIAIDSNGESVADYNSEDMIFSIK